MKILSLILARYGTISCAVHLVFFSTVLPSAAVESTFADSLFQAGDYLNAVHEYKRILFLHPDDPKVIS